ncbi:MAG TPA: hypothetical protein VIK72_10440 [Clostridiaceae bacterium]
MSAIKRYKDVTGVGLKEAKAYIDKLKTGIFYAITRNFCK